MKKVNICVILLVMFTFVAGGLFAQSNARELGFGAQTSGKISYGGETWYRLTPNQDSIIVIDVSSSDFDTYLEVYDSNNKLIDEDDDGSGGTDSKIEIFGSRGASYLIKVRSYDDDESGSFRIMATHKPLPQATEIRFGASRNANLGRGDEHWYSIRPTRAGMVIIDAKSDAVDSFLQFYNSSYKLLDSDDDGGEDLNSRIIFTVEANQTYYIKYKDFDNSERGEYQIIARLYIEAN